MPWVLKVVEIADSATYYRTKFFVRFEYLDRDAMSVHFDKAGRMYLIMRGGCSFEPCQSDRQRIREAALAAVAYERMTGGVKGFPVQELLGDYDQGLL